MQRVVGVELDTERSHTCLSGSSVICFLFLHSRSTSCFSLNPFRSLPAFCPALCVCVLRIFGAKYANLYTVTKDTKRIVCLTEKVRVRGARVLDVIVYV